MKVCMQTDLIIEVRILSILDLLLFLYSYRRILAQIEVILPEILQKYFIFVRNVSQNDVRKRAIVLKISSSIFPLVTTRVFITHQESLTQFGY